MVVHRVLGEHQRGGNLAVGEPPPDGEGDLLLAGGERFGRRVGSCLLRHGDERRRGTLVFGESVRCCLLDRHPPARRPGCGKALLVKPGARGGEIPLVVIIGASEGREGEAMSLAQGFRGPIAAPPDPAVLAKRPPLLTPGAHRR
jgi:hypothetical protein